MVNEQNLKEISGMGLEVMNRARDTKELRILKLEMFRDEGRWKREQYGLIVLWRTYANTKPPLDDLISEPAGCVAP